MIFLDALFVDDFLFYAILESIIFLILLISEIFMYFKWKSQKNSVFKINLIYFCFLTLSVGASASLKFIWRYYLGNFNNSIWLFIYDRGFLIALFLICSNITFKILCLRLFSQKLRFKDFLIGIFGFIILSGYFCKYIEDFWLSIGLLINTIWGYFPALIKTYRKYKEIHDSSNQILLYLFYYSLIYNFIWIFNLANTLWDFFTSISFGPFYYLIFLSIIVAIPIFYKSNNFLFYYLQDIHSHSLVLKSNASNFRNRNILQSNGERSFDKQNKYETIFITCPICHRSTYFLLSPEIIIQCQITEHKTTSIFIRRYITCPHSYIVHIDKKFVIQNYYPVDFSTDIENLLQQLPDLIFYIKSNGLILDVFGNESLLLAPKKEILNRSIYEYFSQDINQKIQKNIKLLIEKKKSTSFTYHLNIEKRQRFFQSRLILSSNDTILALIEDITERTKMEESFLQAQLREEKMESISLMAGGIAHDFNNILVSILGIVNLLQVDNSLSQENKELLQDLEKATLRARDLTDQLLNFARTSEQVEQFKEIDLHQIIHDSLSLIMRGSNCLYKTIFSPNLPHIKGEIGQLSQLFNNLFINAKQAMPSGGTITITTEARSFSTIHDSSFSFKSGNYIHISIKDEGIGIPDSIKKHIFDPYFTTKKEGNGLGLATCYAIVKKHNGYITFESQINAGTIFHIYLPSI
ncbi:two-component system sensor histidine kinase NtrB [Candidatus Harpocratesius sp.]